MIARRSWRSALARDDSGQAMVEFALVIPIFLLLLLGIVEFARAWNIYEVLTDAAREGARNAVVDNPTVSEDDVRNIIVEAGERARIVIHPYEDIEILPAFRTGRGTVVTVRITHQHELRWVTLLWRLATGEETITMVSEFSMRNE